MKHASQKTITMIFKDDSSRSHDYSLRAEAIKFAIMSLSVDSLSLYHGEGKAYDKGGLLKQKKYTMPNHTFSRH